jgi:hypothetical protein
VTEDVAERMKRYAFILVQAAREASGGTLLDYGLKSLGVLDRLIRTTMPARLRTDPEEVAEVVGAYVGETLRRHLGGGWCLVDGRPRLALPGGALLDPIARAKLRLTHGARYALDHYATLVSRGEKRPEEIPKKGLFLRALR